MNGKRNLTAETIRVVNTRPAHAEQVCKLLLRTYGYPEDTPYFSNFMRPQDVLHQIKRFPQGQFVALAGKKVVGMACTMLTDHSPYDAPRSWYEAIGDRGIRAHKPEGT
ncbi:MAG: hypothetical protein HXY40_17555 [Chloroflexi bacterium]|nr:hypothetical protein [Chloroflexota bacterium]